MNSEEKKLQNKILKEKVEENKNIAHYSLDELNYIQKPIGKAIYKAEPIQSSKKRKAHWSDRVLCDVCNKYYTRSAKSNHVNTEYHKVYLKMNKKLQKLLINV
jgi:formylmethanofuran dehydrogenase subunit E